MKHLATDEMIDKIFKEIQKSDGSISGLVKAVSDVKGLVNQYLNDAFYQGSEYEKNKKIKNQQTNN